MTVIRMLNPGAVLLPPVRKLFLAALERGCLDAEYAIQRTAASAKDPRMGIFIGLEEGEPRAMITVRLPGDPRLDRPLFDLATNFGSQALADEVLQVAIAFTRAAGYNVAWTFNQSGHSDAAYIRNVRRHGLQARHRCSLLELDLKEEPSNGRGRKQQQLVGE